MLWHPECDDGKEITYERQYVLASQALLLRTLLRNSHFSHLNTHFWTQTSSIKMWRSFCAWSFQDAFSVHKTEALKKEGCSIVTMICLSICIETNRLIVAFVRQCLTHFVRAIWCCCCQTPSVAADPNESIKRFSLFSVYSKWKKKPFNAFWNYDTELKGRNKDQWKENTYS